MDEQLQSTLVKIQSSITALSLRIEKIEVKQVIKQDHEQIVNDQGEHSVIDQSEQASRTEVPVQVQDHFSQSRRQDNDESTSRYKASASRSI